MLCSKMFKCPNTCISCILARYLNEMVTTGSDLVVDDSPLLDMPQANAEDCASLCNKNAACVSMNFCPESAFKPSSCVLSKKSVFDTDTKTKTSVLCRNYEKDYKVPQIGSAPTTAESGLSGGGFFGLLSAMFLVGIALGVAGYLGYGYLQERRGRDGGLGVSVRFLRHKDDAL